MSFHSQHIQLLVDYTEGCTDPAEALEVYRLIKSNEEAAKYFCLVQEVVNRVKVLQSRERRGMAP